MLTKETIESYVSGLDCGDGKKAKVKTALTRFMDYQVDNNLDSATDAEIAGFMAKNAGKWKQASTYETHIREYFGLPKIEERSNTLPMEENTNGTQSEVTEYEPVEEKSKRRGVRRVQVSVYLTPETYSVLHTLSSVTHDSVSDMLSKAGDELAKKNYNTAEQVRERLQGFNVEY